MKKNNKNTGCSTFLFYGMLNLVVLTYIFEAFSGGCINLGEYRGEICGDDATTVGWLLVVFCIAFNLYFLPKLIKQI